MHIKLLITLLLICSLILSSGIWGCEKSADEGKEMQQQEQMEQEGMEMEPDTTVMDTTEMDTM